MSMAKLPRNTAELVFLLLLPHSAVDFTQNLREVFANFLYEMDIQVCSYIKWTLGIHNLNIHMRMQNISCPVYYVLTGQVAFLSE